MKPPKSLQTLANMPADIIQSLKEIKQCIITKKEAFGFCAYNGISFSMESPYLPQVDTSSFPNQISKKNLTMGDLFLIEAIKITEPDHLSIIKPVTLNKTLWSIWFETPNWLIEILWDSQLDKTVSLKIKEIAYPILLKPSVIAPNHNIWLKNDDNIIIGILYDAYTILEKKTWKSGDAQSLYKIRVLKDNFKHQYYNQDQNLANPNFDDYDDNNFDDYDDPDYDDLD